MQTYYQKFLIGLSFFFVPSFGFTEVNDFMPSTSDILLQVLGALLLIVSLIFLTAWVAKRSRLLGYVQNRSLSVVATLNLGRREKVVLLEACGKTLLLGVTQQNINILTESLSDSLSDSLNNDQSLSKSSFSTRDANGLSNTKKVEFSSFLKNILAGSGSNSSRTDSNKFSDAPRAHSAENTNSENLKREDTP